MSRYLLRRRNLTPSFMSGLAREVDQLQDSVQRMFESPLGLQPASLPRLQALAWVPPLEIHETEKSIVMTVELPGLEREDVAIEIEDDVFTLRGQKRTEHREGDEKKEFLLEERSYGSFERSFSLPPTVNVDKVVAHFEKGVLTVMLPKAESVKARGREIKIEAK
jgi:HSP20 family protein